MGLKCIACSNEQICIYAENIGSFHALSLVCYWILSFESIFGRESLLKIFCLTLNIKTPTVSACRHVTGVIFFA